MSVNKVILVGNVGQDPEVKSTSDGRELATFSIATTESWKDKNSGEKKDKTEWHRIVIFAPGLVNIVKNYVKKGSKLYLEGQLQTRKWNDAAGIEKYTTEIVLQNFNSSLQMLDSNRGTAGSGYSENSPPSSNKNNSNQNSSNKPSNNFNEELEDDIPF